MGNEDFNLNLQNDDIEDFAVDFGEVTETGGSGTSNFDELSNRPKYSGQTMTSNTNIPKVPTAVSELNNDMDYQNWNEVQSAVNTIVGVEAENRTLADNNLQSQIDAITASSDVTDIVGTHADLENYDTSTLGDNDIIKVLQDETHSGETTYYRWSTSTQTFSLIGEEGPYYTKSAVDAFLDTKQDKNTAVTTTQLNTRLDNLTILRISQTDYDNLQSYDANTLYVITGA